MHEVGDTTRHVVLVGLMGVGKTTTGVALAAHLGRPFRDSDDEIQAATGLTVRELGDRDGVDAMHAIEARELLDALGAPGPTVIGAAASIVDDETCREALASAATPVVWLRARPDVVGPRFGANGEHRPIVGDAPEALLARQMVERGPALEAIATIVIDVDERTPDEVVARVVEALG